MGCCRSSRTRVLLFLALGLSVLCVVLRPIRICQDGVRVPALAADKIREGSVSDNTTSSNSSSTNIAYSADMGLIFIGGMPRSGTTLMRVMLDAHPAVRCGEETRVIPRILGMRSHIEASPVERKRLDAAGVTSQVLNAAVKAFILEVIAKHGDAAPRLCNKDPFTLRSALYLSRQFPAAKFLLMIRDGRAVVHSIISRHVTILGFDLSSYRTCLQKWNSAMESMYGQCQRVGPQRCLPVYYEQLALHPRQWMRRILAFLDLPWNDSVLHHQDYIGQHISLSIREKSTDQVIKPVNSEALSKWVGHLPEDVLADMSSLAPMLSTLGYDPRANPPNYGQPDPQVAHNTLHIRSNALFWKQRERELWDLLGRRPLDHRPEDALQEEQRPSGSQERPESVTEPGGGGGAQGSKEDGGR